jgi:pyridoxamine 5'-phosphate oxidase
MSQHNPLIPPTPSEAEYLSRPLKPEEDLPAVGDPMALFRAWLAEAHKSEPNDPNAMTLATVDADGLPDARMVLLKDVDARGFVFYTNLGSAKGRELASDPKAALLFHWKSLRRQVRVRGGVERVTDAEADAYFASRARHSQIGAWASDQSRPLEGRFALEKRVADFGLKFGLGPVPRPPHWSGFRVLPEAIEFWRDRPFRLHERRLYLRAEGGWTTQTLYP